MNGAGSGKGEAGSGTREAGGPRPFAEVMREEGMTAPVALRDSMNAALSHSAPGGVVQKDAPSADDLLRAAENLLDKVLASQCDNRDSALDLLTVDALVTRAMLVAARDTKTLAEFPDLAMKRIAAR